MNPTLPPKKTAKRDQSFCIHTAGDEHAVCYAAFVFTWLHPGFFKRDPGRLFDYGNSLFACLVAAFQKMVFPAHAAPVCASFLTAPLYYLIWVLLYQVYNRFAGLPAMTVTQVLQNSGPNLLFYLQVFSSLHIDLFIREREAQYQREQELRELAHRAEVQALKAQIQPHFLFNTLNSISASVPAAEEHTRVLIARLANVFRYGLDSTRHELVSLEKELDFIANYLNLEKERFGSRLHYTIEVTPGIQNMLVPPMLLQPLVENAIRHGIEPSVSGGTIAVCCTRQADKVLIAVESTGTPCSKAPAEMLNGSGLGLPNTARRLINQFNEALHISVSGLQVKVWFALPYRAH